MHFWRIHSRVARRVLLDTPEHIRHIIANDAAHTTEEYKWFEKKVNEDTTRLFEDSNYHDNSPESFKYSKVECI